MPAVIFKRAVHAMADASQRVMQQCAVTADQIDLVVPHQANLRIIESVAKYAGVPMDKVMVTVQKYGNMSAATVPVALVEALEEGRIAPGGLVLMPAFGGAECREPLASRKVIMTASSFMRQA